MSNFCIFGTHPRLSLAELRALKPHIPAPRCISQAAIFDDPEWDGAAMMHQLGGTAKLGVIVGDLPTSEVTAERIVDMVSDRLPDHSIDFGWTVYGSSRASTLKLERLALSIKKAFKARGTSSRWVTGKESNALSPAAVAKLKLTTEGLDLNLFIDGTEAWLGLTTHVQDADAWGLRDFGRPARDERVGMLPPKLARMMINLAHPTATDTIIDPFCGGGTVIMEAMVTVDAKRFIASDSDPIQVANTKENLTWCTHKYLFPAERLTRLTALIADARHLEKEVIGTVDCVITEGYLGPLLSGQETMETLEKNVRMLSTLWLDTLRNIKPLLNSGARLVVVWPAFKSSHGTARVELDTEIEKLGYTVTNPLQDWDPTNGPLLYMRPEQRVMRRIVVLEAK